MWMSISKLGQHCEGGTGKWGLEIKMLEEITLCSGFYSNNNNSHQTQRPHDHFTSAKGGNSAQTRLLASYSPWMTLQPNF